MSDEFNPHERRTLDAWTALEPPNNFADRVLELRPVRRWLPYAVAGAGTAAAAALVLVVLRTDGVVEKPSPIAHTEGPRGLSPDAGAGVEPLVVDSLLLTDSPILPIVDAGTVAPASDPDVDLEVGTTATLHDPRGETRVNFHSQRCNSGLQIELARDMRFTPRTANQGSFGVVLTVGAGQWNYRASCMSGGMPQAPFASGRLTVVRDAGRRPLPRTPTTVRIDRDGGNFDVSYQASLPTVQITPPPGAERLHIHDQGRQIHSIEIRSSSLVTLPPLADGTYKLTFTDGGLTTGKLTTLSIAFDQTGPQVVLELPAENAPATPTLDVRGATLPGWTVNFEGIKLPTDAQQRFIARVPLRPGFKSIAVRFDHPTRGTHYYVRRLR